MLARAIILPAVRGSARVLRVGYPSATPRILMAPITPLLSAVTQRFNSTSIAASDVREGDLIELDGVLYRVLSRAFSRTAMGRAYVQAEVRSVVENIKKDLRFRSEDMITKAVLDPPGRFEILYSSGDLIACMHTTTYEQVELPASILGEQQRYIQNGMHITIESYKGNPTIITLPPKVSVLVKEMDEGGGVALVDTAVTPDAAFSSQWKVRVPKFIKAGDKIIIDTIDSKYVGRE